MKVVEYYHLECEGKALDFSSLEAAHEYLAEKSPEELPALEWLEKAVLKGAVSWSGITLAKRELRFADATKVAPRERSDVTARELFASPAWTHAEQRLPLMLGKNLDGEPVVIDLARAPHLLMAGETGSGKSVTIGMMLQSLLLRFTPEQLRLILVDPKYLELTQYQAVPHLLAPILHEPEEVVAMLRWAIDEMNRRYRVIAAAGARSIWEFNARAATGQECHTAQGKSIPQTLPYIVIVINELADVMLARARKDAEDALGVLAAKARGVGIHMIIATVRPDAKVITGVVKANFPTRIALRVLDASCSRQVLDEPGAELLRGRGDMLLKGWRVPPERIQGGIVSTAEVEELVRSCGSQAPQVFDAGLMAALGGQ